MNKKTVFYPVVFLVVVLGYVIGCVWASENGVHVYTTTVCMIDYVKHPEIQDMDVPIEIVGLIQYKGNYIVRETAIVPFCEVKAVKKEMKQKLNDKWKQLRQSCN